MGLFGGGNNDREEVHLGEPDEDEEETRENSEDKGNPADVGTIDFGSGDDTENTGSRNSSASGSDSKLRDEISSMDSVETGSSSSSSSSGSSSGGSSHRVTSSSGEPDLEEIRDQNQEIIDKLEKVLNRL